MKLQFEVRFLGGRENMFDTIENLEESGLIDNIDDYPGTVAVIKGKEITAIPGWEGRYRCQLESPATIQIRLYPKVHLSEFGFPTFYGMLN